MTLLYVLALLVFVTSSIHCHTLFYNIIPASSDACPTQPCFTLSEITNSSINISSSNTVTLNFNPGNHILESELRIGDIQSLNLEKSNLSLDTKIICKQTSAFHLYRISMVHISKLVFVSCGGNKVKEIGQILILGTSFHGQGSSSTALELVKTAGTIEESTFQFHYNTKGNLKNLTVKYWTWEKIQASHVSGALFVAKSNLTIIRSSFKHNGAEVGGAVFCELESSIAIINSTFSLNQALSSTNQCYGGAILSQERCNMIIINCTFYKNRACTSNEQGGGGAIAALTRTQIDIKGSHFRYSEAVYGGAVLAWKAAVAVNESVFHNNEAISQGGAFCVWNSNIYVSTSRFNNNRAIYVGGALQAETTTVYITRSEFVQNDGSSGGAISASDCHVMISSSTFLFNEGVIDGGAISTHRCDLKIKGSEFNNNKASWGGAVKNIKCTTVNITGSLFFRNVADQMHGGAISVWSISVKISRSGFIGNEASIEGGAIESRQSGTINIDWTLFTNNTATFNGGAIYANQLNAIYMIFKVTFTNFESNVAQIDGGAIKVRHNTTTDANIEISNSTFRQNRAKHNGGAMSIVSISTLLTVAVVSEGDFDNNEAMNGGAIHTQWITFSLNDSCFSENTGETGIVYTTQSAVFLSGDISMWNNTGSVFLFSSNLTLVDRSNTKVYNSVLSLQNTSGLQQGGAITAVQSIIVIYGTCTLMENYAEDGGAIHATESKIRIYGQITLTNNTATNSGGGIHLYQSELKCSLSGSLKVLKNYANDKGGGIHAISSQIISELMEKSGTLVVLSGNSARQGGGICMEVNSKIYILKLQHSTREQVWWNHRRFILSENSANYGAAMYVTDDTNFATCTSTSYRQYSTLTECFIQVLALHDELRSDLILDYVNFTDNFAQYSGSNLFGGLLDRCTVSPYAEVYSKYNPNFQQRPEDINGLRFIKAVSTIVNDTIVSISSEPVQICFCENNEPNCDMKQKDIAIKKGYMFTISLVAVDQVNHTVNATIRSFLSSIRGRLDEDQASQSINDSCSTLKFSVFSPHESEKVIMYAEGPCKDAELSQKQVNVQFLSCTCPVGFQRNKEMDTNCVCECDATLRPIITSCYEKNKTVVREGTFWITHLNTSDNSSINKYLIYPYCPLDYCHPSTVKVYIILSEMNGSDGQCNFNRSGMLCGRCQPGFSLSLGSTHCVSCSKHWPAICVAILIAASLAGIVLVALLLMLNLTVASGTINGIIFYANVINANSSTFFPFKEPNLITVFVSWLNLEFGFDTCFFEGMDTYSKTLLQLAFPIYVIVLVVIVIFVSERSTKFARLIGRKNPVATLATLVLLSYTRLIQTIIAGLSFSILKYPDRPHELVWLSDGNVGYLTGKHIVLFVLSIGILLAGIAYTTLLFSWQWLLFYRHNRIFKCLSLSSKLILFLEPYHAPYLFKHRYWTGLLLIVRVVLYLASALNVSRAPGVDLVVTGIVMIAVFMLKAHVSIRSCIYRRLPLDILENTCYMNIILFSVASLYVLEAKGDQITLAYISGAITLMLLLTVLLYHITFELCSASKLWNSLKQQLIMKRHNDEVSLVDCRAADELRERLNPTVTWIDAPSNKEGSLLLHTETHTLSK